LKEAKVRLTAQQQDLYEHRRVLKSTIKTMEDGYKLLTQQEHIIQRNLNRNKFYEIE
jgi:hypothetical protein